MWPFRRKPKANFIMVAVLYDALPSLMTRWASFHQSHQQDSLEDQIGAFHRMIEPELLSQYPALLKLPQSDVFAICTIAVERSGTHTGEDIAAAISRTPPVRPKWASGLKTE